MLLNMILYSLWLHVMMFPNFLQTVIQLNEIQAKEHTYIHTYIRTCTYKKYIHIYIHIFIHI